MESNASLGHTRARSTRSREGFSLIEVMVAMLVLGFGLLTIASAQIYAVKGGQFGRHRTQAVSIAQSQMEQLKSLRWTQIVPTGWTAGTNVATTVEAPTNQIEQNYTVQWRITDVLADQTRNLDVRVAWTESNGNTKNYTVSSTRFNYEGL
ncbi:MAG: prepilin-type N-terminal cleavage/methylation domain-containing protein [Myxococcota bacterium]|nr:prepilin-type N-terminal cleavage/methylation domain-containing protein [Myxococcota bacterium]